MDTTNVLYKNLIAVRIIGLCFCLSVLSGCEDFLETDNPVGQISSQEVFENEKIATAAVTTLYGKLRDEILVTGSPSGMGVLMGLYADELDFYGMPWEPSITFYSHQIVASDAGVQTIWNKSYNLIYMCNTIIEELKFSNSLSETTKEQLKGEALFVRALVHFYLVNLFGDIPYIITTDYKTNSGVERISEAEVYENIIMDLTNAKSLLGDTYVSQERTRPNKWVASALLARVYLYAEQWGLAETESSLLISNTSLYNLEMNIEEVFLKESTSAIWQLKPKSDGSNSKEAATFVFVTAPPPFVALSNTLVNAMDEEDLRRINWVGEATDGTETWYYAYKYKQYPNAGGSREYSTVFRLAEQYLIRAEARAKQGNSLGTQADLNVIRGRAGLPNTTATSQEELIAAIITERRFELFTEHGHRWFDLRRYEMAGDVLESIKPGWKPTDVLLPIPEADMLTNPNLNPQNPGY